MKSLTMVVGACAYVLLVLVAATSESAGQGVSCENHGVTRVCSLPSAAQRIAATGGRVVVGAVDYLAAFSPELELEDSVNLAPSDSRIHTCVNEQFQPQALCRNFIRVVLPVDPHQEFSHRVLVCGTNAFFPKCRFHLVANLTDWQYATSESHRDNGFSPHSNESNVVALLASNGHFFSATSFSFLGQQIIGVSQQPFESAPTFPVRTPLSDPRWIGDSIHFIASYEVGQHVYFFARERAAEILPLQVEYSRVIRICRNDPGFELIGGDRTLTFLTFQKARLMCRHQGQNSPLPYDYDRLQATFLLQDIGSQPMLYGVFSSPTNGPEGAALCKFRFSSIQSVFDSGKYLKRNNSDGRWEPVPASPFVCPGEEGVQREEDEAEQLQLVSTADGALEPQVLHRMDGDQFTHIAVDVAQLRGEPLEVVLLSLRNGGVVQVVSYESRVYNASVPTAGTPIIQDILIEREPQSEVRQVIFTSGNTVQSFSLGNCSLHDTCYKCIDSRDPYCAWHVPSSHCLNKLTSIAQSLEATSFLDPLASDEGSVSQTCGPRPSVPTRPPEPDPSTCTRHSFPSTGSGSGGPSDHSTADFPTGTVTPSPTQPEFTDSESLNTREDTQENIGLLAGASVGGFLVGIPVGLVVCYLFFSLFLKRGKPPAPTGATIHANNQLQEEDSSQTAGKQNGIRHIELSHQVQANSATKNVNQYPKTFDEDDDVLADLPSSGHPAPSYPWQQQGRSKMPPALHMGGHRTHRGRTESTQRLRLSESDWESSLSPVTSPV